MLAHVRAASAPLRAVARGCPYLGERLKVHGQVIGVEDLGDHETVFSELPAGFEGEILLCNGAPVEEKG